MISVTHAKMLKEGFGERGGKGVNYKIFENKGHMLPWEARDEFNALVEGMVEKGRELSLSER